MLLELSEYDRGSIAVSEPTRQDIELADQLNADLDRKLEIRWLRNGRLEARSTSWVGVVRLSTVTIQVRPKYAGNELGVVRMLEYGRGVRALRRTVATRTLPPDGADLLDLLCALFAEESELLLRDGLLHDYSTEEESLPTLRGSLRFRDQATRRFGQLDVLECRFDDFHANVLENQLLRTGLAAAGRVCGDHLTRQRVRRLEHALADLSSLGPTTSAFYRERLSYGRRNERYRRAHDLALLLLDHLGVEDLYGKGQTESFAFLINMNDVFETFITTLVKEAFAHEKWQLSAQRRERSVIQNRDTGKRYASIIPDIVLSNGDQQIPFDCKYKLYGPKRKLSTSDIYQSFLYAFALSADTTDGARAGIIYPSMQTSLTPRLTVSRINGPPSATLTGISIDLLGILNRLGDQAAWPDVLAEVRAALNDVLEPTA